MNLGNIWEAHQKYQDCLMVDKMNYFANSRYHLNLGICFLRMHKHDDALAEFDKSIECNPSHVKAHIRKGEVL